MFSKSSLLHLRIPFSYFLLPVFIFAVSQSPNLSEGGLMWIFIILHLMTYPASNAFNSYFDKDEGSIGGLKNPPPVENGLYYLATLLDIAALTLSIVYVNWKFALLVGIYIGISRAYSHPFIRIKKHTFGSWALIGFFQGMLVYWAVYIGLNDFPLAFIFKANVLYPAFLSSLVLYGAYPMTQIYQHEEDGKRGEVTLSARLGIKGTFLFTGAFFALAMTLFYFYFGQKYNSNYNQTFLMAMIPILLYFIWWYWQVSKSTAKANYSNTMRLNFVSATFLGGFFLYVFLNSTNILSVAGQY
jgi:1,4-dihydroxy-2-naphthoate octaprenyltransferase